MASFFQITLDTTAPGQLSVCLNDGALYTPVRAVTLKAAVDDEDTTGYQMKVWGIEGAADEASASWETYTPQRTVILTGEDGLKTVYVKVRDDVGNETVGVSASITVDTDIPVVSVIGPDRTRLSTVDGFDSAVITFTSSAPFEAYKVCVVPAPNSMEGVGTVIPADGGSEHTQGNEGGYAADTNITVTIKGADLNAAAPGDGVKLLKVFVKNAKGLWSVA